MALLSAIATIIAFSMVCYTATGAGMRGYGS